MLTPPFVSTHHGQSRGKLTIAAITAAALVVFLLGIGILDTTLIPFDTRAHQDWREASIADDHEKPLALGRARLGVLQENRPRVATQSGTGDLTPCVPYTQLQASNPGPYSTGRRGFPYLRPPPECRTFRLQSLEDMIERVKGVIKDADLARLFENTWPNTLDTMIKWRGYARRKDDVEGNSTTTDEELAYVITGDIDAMWLRDSASQIMSYVSLLEPSTDANSLASLWRGVINAHARYIKISPYCHSFQPPEESGIPPTHNGAYLQNHPQPPYNPIHVFDCKWELDSLASFLQISAAYHQRTNDSAFFAKYVWPDAVRAAVDAAAAMRLGTYDEEGHVLPSAWTFTGWTNRGSETLTNNGLGNPTRENGMVRTSFRPSDDATIYQLMTPSNMMFARYLEETSRIAETISDKLTKDMGALAASIRRGIARDAVVRHAKYGDIFAYEVDGFGSQNLMDDANVPSLLAMPLWNFTEKIPFPADQDNNTTTTTTTTTKDYRAIYRNTRAFILSQDNPYYAKGPVLSAVGSPHVDPGKAWPMAAIVAAKTAYEEGVYAGDDASPKAVKEWRMNEVAKQLAMVLNSTSGRGVIHETVDSWQEANFTRPWFGWANGLFGELILKMAQDEDWGQTTGNDSLLGRSWQY